MPKLRIDRLTLLALLVLLLLHGALRLLAVGSFPPFIDESWHIGFAREVLSGRLIAGAPHSKLFVPVWIAIFQPTGDASLYVARIATVLFSLLALSLVYRLAAEAAGRTAGIIAAVLYLSAPYLLFYERLALIDTYMLTFGLLTVWLGFRLRRGFYVRGAILCGLALAGGLAAKGTGIVLVVIPALAALLFSHHQSKRTVLRWLLLCYGVFASIWLPLYLLFRWRNIDYFGLAATLSNTSAATDFVARLGSNIAEVWQIDVVYFSAFGLLLLVALSLYWLLRQARPAAYLLLCLLIPTAAIILLSPNVRSRYIIYHVPLLIVTAAAGAQIARRWIEQRIGMTAARAALTIILLLWVGFIFLPFYTTLLRAPADLLLPPVDRSEYITADSAGFALPEIAAHLSSAAQAANQPLSVIGLLANCDGLKLLLPTSSQVSLECPVISWDGARQSELAALINQRAAENAGIVYVIVENLPYISTAGITAPLQPLTTFARPDAASELTIYQLG